MQCVKLYQIIHHFCKKYWTPKLQSNLTKVRFVITVPMCLMKPLSNAIKAALKLIQLQIIAITAKRNTNLVLEYSGQVRTIKLSLAL